LRGTVFLSVFEWTFRKGWDVLLKAWAKAFSPNDDVTLLLRTYPMKRPGVKVSAEDIERQINTYLGKLGTARRKVAPIVVLHDPIADADMPRLYATASAYVSPSRGEGWGRPMLEAMASGLPTIATRWSGNREFMHDDNSLLIDSDGLEKIDGREELEFYRGQRWARPSAKHLSKLLTNIAADRDAAAALGARAQAEVAQRWSWSAAVDAASARLADTDARLRRATPKPQPCPCVGSVSSTPGTASPTSTARCALASPTARASNSNSRRTNTARTAPSTATPSPGWKRAPATCCRDPRVSRCATSGRRTGARRVRARGS
jgi:hypothetical protein